MLNDRRRNYQEDPLRVLLLSCAITLAAVLLLLLLANRKAEGAGLNFEAGIGTARYGVVKK